MFSFHRPKHEEFQKAGLYNCFPQPLSSLNLLFLRSETCCSLLVEETVVAAICPGCPRTIPTDSPELKELLKVSTEKYNSESDDDFYYKGGEIQSATVQVGIFHRDEEQTWHYYWPELNVTWSLYLDLKWCFWLSADTCGN